MKKPREQHAHTETTRQADSRKMLEESHAMVKRGKEPQKDARRREASGQETKAAALNGNDTEVERQRFERSKALYEQLSLVQEELRVLTEAAAEQTLSVRTDLELTKQKIRTKRNGRWR